MWWSRTLLWEMYDFAIQRRWWVHRLREVGQCWWTVINRGTKEEVCWWDSTEIHSAERLGGSPSSGMAATENLGVGECLPEESQVLGFVFPHISSALFSISGNHLHKSFFFPSFPSKQPYLQTYNLSCLAPCSYQVKLATIPWVLLTHHFALCLFCHSKDIS